MLRRALTALLLSSPSSQIYQLCNRPPLHLLVQVEGMASAADREEAEQMESNSHEAGLNAAAQTENASADATLADLHRDLLDKVRVPLLLRGVGAGRRLF